MTATVRRLMSIAEVRRARLAFAASLGVLTIVFGVGLMGTSGLSDLEGCGAARRSSR